VTDFDWRPLIYMLTIAAFMLLWVVGCTLISESGSNSTTTAYPRVTLTVGRIEQTILPTDSPRPHRYTASPVITDTSPHSNFSPPPADSAVPASIMLNIPPPICYESATARTSCLGRVENLLPVAVAGVTIDVRLYQVENSSVDGNVTIEQALIPAFGAAPFRLDFPNAWRDYAGVAAWLDDAVIARDSSVITPTVTDVRIETSGELRTVYATIRNDDAAMLRLGRAVITLIDEHERVYAYQVIRYHGRRLAADATLSITVSMLPAAPAPQLRALVYIEAHR